MNWHLRRRSSGAWKVSDGCSGWKSGPLFYRRRTAEKEILETLALLADGTSPRSLARATGHKEETILDWLKKAGQQAQALEEVRLAEYPVGRGQRDALWSFVGHKGEKKGYAESAEQGPFWRATMIDIDTRLRVARGFGKSETQADLEVFATLKRRGHPTLPRPRCRMVGAAPTRQWSRSTVRSRRIRAAVGLRAGNGPNPAGSTCR
jgi:hypothetical protein